MTLALIALNVLGFMLEMAGSDAFIDAFALWPPHAALALQNGAPPFHLWQLVTYSALHANATHLAFNMLGLYLFGREVEPVLGSTRLGVLYFASVLAGALTQLAVAMSSGGPAYPTVGASAGVFGVLVAYALLYPRRRVVLLFPPIPMPAWLFATGYAVIELALGVAGDVSGVAHFAHLGGMLGSVVLMLWWKGLLRHRAG